MDNKRSLTPVLSIIAAVLAIAVAVAITFVIVSSNNNDDEPSAPVTATVSQPVPQTTTPAPQETTPSQETYVPPAEPSGSPVVEGGQCFESEARSYGTDANGKSLVCTDIGAGFRWVAGPE